MGRISRVRGAAMVETAVSLSFSLLTIFGAFDLGLMGYFQLQLDGATFFYTHAYASGASDTANLSKFGSQLAGLFPNVATAKMSPEPAAPPTTDMPVNYTQWGTAAERFGGASLLRPQRMMTQATYTIAGLNWNAIFPQASQPITLSAGNVDARPIIGNHDDDAQGADYNSSTVYNTLTDPLVGDDQNVPPYYFNFGFMWACKNNDWSSDGSRCNQPELNSLGLAEILKDDNYSANTNPNNGIDSGGTFELVKYHQQVYATLAADVAAFTTIPTASVWNAAMDPTLNTIAQWDVDDIQDLSAPNGSQLGRQNPLHPAYGCTWC